jgi:UDP-N-acetyl-2-amino-2-deoxyglucuronate dehydrogenase
MRFAVIGCGEIAPTHVRALQSLGERVSVAACSDVVPERAVALAQAFQLRAATFEEILSDPAIDAVTVCTPSGLHAAVGVPALLAGKHVLVEKPMDVTVAACDLLLEARRSSGKTLGVVSQRRFDPAAQRIKAAVERGTFGALVYADCRVPWFRSQHYYDSGDWRGTWDLDGGGCLMNQGLHTIDLMRWMCGPVAHVSAYARTAAHDRIEVEDVLCGTIVFDSGALGTVMTTTSSYPAFPARLGIHGSRGGAVLEGDALAAFSVIDGEHLPGERPMAHAVEVARGGTRAATPPLVKVAPPSPGQIDSWTIGHRRQLLDFVDAVESGREPVVDGIEGRNAVELIEAMYRSVRTGVVEKTR